MVKASVLRKYVYKKKDLQNAENENHNVEAVRFIYSFWSTPMVRNAESENHKVEAVRLVYSFLSTNQIF